MRRSFGGRGAGRGAYGTASSGIDGWVADSACTVIVGTAAEEDLRIVRAAEEALEAAIQVARPGNRLGVISAAICAVARDHGHPVNNEFGGHGIGRTMHEEPHVSNIGKAGRGLQLRPGLTLAIEPWFAQTTDRIVYDPDGWTIRSADGSRTAHSEHTVAITEDGPLVLTRRDSEAPWRTRRHRPASRRRRYREAAPETVAPP